MTRTTTSLYGTCQNLFSQYPLAVRTINESGTVRSMVLMAGGNSEAAFFILTHYAKGGDHYSLSAWRAGQIAEIEPDSKPAAVGKAASVLADAVPLPRDGSFFGWKTGGVITTTMTIYSQYSPETPVPTRVIAPLEGIPDSSWPPFTSKTLAESSFWDHYRNGNIVDLAPLVAATPGAVFWAHPDTLTYACCAVARNITSPDGWMLSRGCYVWWQSLRDGETAGPLDKVLAGDVTDVSPRFRTGR